MIIQTHEVDGPNTSFTANRVKQEEISSHVLRAWIHWTENMTVSMAGKEFSMTRLRLIDVNHHYVCEVNLPCRYACLSYVWGDVQQTQNTALTRDQLYKPGGLNQDSLQLPLTIKDAIEATRRAEMPYLWIDALCIEQDDPDDKQKIIASMASIYGNSALTIVGSTNRTPLDGLPGVSSVPRAYPQISEEVQGSLLSVAFHDAPTHHGH